MALWYDQLNGYGATWPGMLGFSLAVTGLESEIVLSIEIKWQGREGSAHLLQHPVLLLPQL